MQDLSSYQAHQLKLLKWESEKFLTGVDMIKDEDGYTVQFPDEYMKYLICGQVETMLVYPTGQRKVKYRGFVSSVEGNSVSLLFKEKYICGTQFDVKFKDSTWNITNQIVAVKNAGGLRDLLFPSPTINPTQQTMVPKLSLFNKQLEKDPEQCQAIQQIVAGTYKPAPYILFGPPGTGKTVTLVEAIIQIANKDSCSHILACASHNKDADLICQEIVKKVPKSTVLRMYAKIVDFKRIPRDLQDCCNRNGKEIFIPSGREIRKYKIIVSTLFNAARLVGPAKGHFTHIFLDNAERALETECLIPISGLHDKRQGQLILAGDLKQFGPIVKSRLASRNGLGVSMLERLMTKFPMYQKKHSGFNKYYITMLQHNYRSHPAIVKIPAAFSVNEEVKACTDTSLPSTQISNSCANWDHLPKKGFPVIFHAVHGVEEFDSKRSFYNKAEVEKLMYYVKKLLRTMGTSVQPAVKPSDIGIMARYKKQVQEINEALQKVGEELKITVKDKLKVGTVETFKGQYKRVILLSTICSSQTDGKRMWNPKAFVQDEKAAYVAVTRAKALLIVVGDPTVWSQGDTWHHLIQYCKDKGGYRDDKN